MPPQLLGPNQVRPIVSQRREQTWGERSPRSGGLAPFGGDKFRLRSERCSPLFNELPHCDSAAHFRGGKKEEEEEEKASLRELGREKVSPDNSVLLTLRGIITLP